MARLLELKQDKVIKILESNGFMQARSAKHITFKTGYFVIVLLALCEIFISLGNE